MLLSLRAVGEAIPIRVRIRMGIASPTARNDRGDWPNFRHSDIYPITLREAHVRNAARRQTLCCSAVSGTGAASIYV